MAKTPSKYITELTPEQEARMPFYVDKWLKIGLCTDRVDPDKAIPAVQLMYKCADLAPPEKIIFANGPLHAKEILGEKFFTGIMYGCNQAAFLSFYDFFQTEVGIDFEGKLDGLFAVADTCGWVSCFQELAVVHDRPLHIKMDEENRLHCEDGPAILYADGLAVYCWHGIRIPREWIEDKKSLTAEIALTWANIEQRRAACEILGWVNVLANLNAKVIDQDEDPMIGTLLRVTLPEIGEESFLKVKCGTGREFAIPVPPNMKTALEANAWTYDIEPDLLKQLEVRT